MERGRCSERHLLRLHAVAIPEKPVAGGTGDLKLALPSPKHGKGDRLWQSSRLKIGRTCLGWRVFLARHRARGRGAHRPTILEKIVLGIGAKAALLHHSL